MASYSVNKIDIAKTGNNDTYTLDVSDDITALSITGTASEPRLAYSTKSGGGNSIALPLPDTSDSVVSMTVVDGSTADPKLQYTTKGGTPTTINLPPNPDTKNTAGSSATVNTILYLIGATERSSDGVVTYSNSTCYIGSDNRIYSNGAPALTSHQDISGKVDKVTGKGLSTNDFTDAYKNMLDNLEVEVLLRPTQPINIPSAGGTTTKYMSGLTANHELVRWNFSSSSENNPPVSLTWTTYDGYFTIQNTSSFDSSETIQPVFGAIVQKAATDN